MKKKSLSYGIATYRPIEQEKYLINKYQNYLKSIYMPIPVVGLGEELISHNEYSHYEIHNKDLFELIDYAKERDIKINFTLNNCRDDATNRQITNQMLLDAAKAINDLKPYEICCRDRMIETLKYNTNPEVRYCRSFYDGYPTRQQLGIKYDLFDCFVLKQRMAPNRLVDGKENRLVLNVMCPPTCDSCNKDFTKDVAHNWHKDEFWKIKDPYEFYAKALWFGRDIEIFENLNLPYDISYKVGIRLDDKSVTDISIMLANYSTQELDGIETFLERPECRNVFWCHISETKYDFKDFDINKFKEYKTKYWQSMGSTIIQY